jgi:hypothetical protein
MIPFHYAFKVNDIENTRSFYIDLLGCAEGRSTENWIDFNFFGHQLSAHVSTQIPELDYCGQVDGISVPIPHFGCLVSVEDYNIIQAKLENASVHFIVQPCIRYEGEVGEQRTMFFLDNSGNPIELKAFTNIKEVFEGISNSL